MAWFPPHSRHRERRAPVGFFALTYATKCMRAGIFSMRCSVSLSLDPYSLSSNTVSVNICSLTSLKLFQDFFPHLPFKLGHHKTVWTENREYKSVSQTSVWYFQNRSEMSFRPVPCGSKSAERATAKVQIKLYTELFWAGHGIPVPPLLSAVSGSLTKPDDRSDLPLSLSQFSKDWFSVPSLYSLFKS